MAPIDIERFVEKWHEALRLVQPAEAADPGEVDALIGQILAAPALVKLAEVPLLCAAICYLHRVRSGELPRRTLDLYDKLAEQLLHRLDEDRLKRDGYARLAPALQTLDYKDKLSLIRRLAWMMVLGGHSTLEMTQACDVVRKGLEELRKEDGLDPAAVLQALQERSGVLRGASARLVEFTHNRLRSYFAAWRFADESSALVNEIISKAMTGDDLDLAVLVAGQGNEPYRKAMTKGLLNRAQSDRKNRRALQIAAVRCRMMNPLRDDVLNRELDRMEAKLLPPRNHDEAGLLAELGERTVNTLRPAKRRSAEIDAACVRMLRLIEGPAAKSVLGGYLQHEAEEVIEELAQAANPLKVAAIRVRVISDRPRIQFTPLRYLKVRDLKELPDDVIDLTLNGTSVVSVEGFQRFASLRTIHLFGTGVSDLAPLQGLTRLKWLFLDGTGVSDFARLQGLTRLERLSLSGTGVSDLAPLQGLTRLQTLSLSDTQVRDLIPLQGLTNLRGLSLFRTPVVDLDPLKNLSSLEWLDLTYTRIQADDLILAVLKVPATKLYM
jgi:hypothetical protein